MPKFTLKFKGKNGFTQTFRSDDEEQAKDFMDTIKDLAKEESKEFIEETKSGTKENL